MAVSVLAVTGDSADGGGGNDLIDYTLNAYAFGVHGDAGNDTLFPGSGNDTLWGDQGKATTRSTAAQASTRPFGHCRRTSTRCPSGLTSRQ